MKNITVIGAGLAGCEAAISAVRQGVAVDLIEMKPIKHSPVPNLWILFPLIIMR